MTQQYLHASLVDYRSRGILLIGASGSRKSDLALRLIERGGLLVSDDQVLLRHQND
jgi:serine kinase of HPr protein (carbohydrate metabolism regulator)